MATTRVAYPALYDENLCRRCLATNAQKIITGTVIRSIVTSNDLASGPNISLPPRINFCKITSKKKWGEKIFNSIAHKRKYGGGDEYFNIYDE